MVVLPQGRFLMGQTPADEKLVGVVSGERPRHEVTIGYSFAIGRFEVTTEEFSRYVEETEAQVGGTCMIRLMEEGELALKFTGMKHPDSDSVFDHPYAVYITDGSHLQPGLPVEPKQPAVCISRDEITGYLDWLSGKTDRSYRLPTEAEWEYAVRAGTETVAFWGDDLGEACRYANFGDRASGYQASMMAPCAEEIEPAWTAAAGSYEPNPWGLHDMAGNVQEVLEDCWHQDYAGAPADGSPWREDGCQLFIARGGDYELTHFNMRAAERLFMGYVPEDKASRVIEGETAGHTARSNVLGFRVAVSLDPSAWDLR